MAKEKQNKNIRELVIKVLMRDERASGDVSELRIASWMIDNKQTPPRLERREKYTDGEGHEKPGKAKGLSVTDCEYMVKNWATLKPLFLVTGGSAPAPRKPVAPGTPAAPPPPPPVTVPDDFANRQAEDF